MLTSCHGLRATLLTVQNESTAAQILSFNAPHTRVSTKFLTGRTILCSIIIKVLCEITAHQLLFEWSHENYFCYQSTPQAMQPSHSKNDMQSDTSKFSRLILSSVKLDLSKLICGALGEFGMHSMFSSLDNIWPL